MDMSWHSLGGLPLQEETLAESLGELGYHTAMAGEGRGIKALSRQNFR